VYGEDGSKAGSSYDPTTVTRTPVPPAVSPSAPAAITGPYGLVLNLYDPGLFVGVTTPAGSKSMTVSWRLPSCSVAQTTAAEAAYEKVECANRGLCDTTTGECKCFTGYAGYNCAQQTVYV
jgi:EGF-like domain